MSENVSIITDSSDETYNSTLTGSLVEDTMLTLTTNGRIGFTDGSAAGTAFHAVSVASSTVTSGSGTGPATALGTLSVNILDDATGGADKGRVDWSYSVNNAAIQFLALGETRIETFTVQILDNNGDTVFQDIAITLTGANDGVTITSTGPDAQTVSEDALTEATVVELADPRGSIAFTDFDALDTHTVAITVDAATGARGGMSDADLVALISGFVTEEANAASGIYNWSFAGRTSQFNYLKQGETLSIVYRATVSDGNGGSAFQTFAVAVTGVNDGVVAVADANTGDPVQASDNGGSGDLAASGNVLSNDIDLDAGDSKTVAGVAAGTTGDAIATGAGVAVQGTYGTVTIQADGSYSYVLDGELAAPLAQGETATDIFSYTVTDGAGATSTTTLTITVTGGNDAPVASADSLATSIVEAGADGDGISAVSGEVLGNDADVDGDALTVTGIRVGGEGASVGSGLSAIGTYGSITIDADGTYTYTLDNDDEDTQRLAAGVSASETFTYEVSDGKGGFDAATITIALTGANDAPVARADDNGADTIKEAGVGPGDTPNAGDDSATGNLLDNDTDVDGGDTAVLISIGLTTGGVAGAPTIIIPNNSVSIEGRYGTLALGTDGVWTYGLNNDDADTQAIAAGETREETFSYTIRDAAGETSSATLTLTIEGTNDAPVLGFFQNFANDGRGFTTGGGYGDSVFVSGADATGDGFFVLLSENGSGPFTRFGGYSSEFVNGAQAEVKVYLDVTWATDAGFQYTVAANGTDGAHQRDFGFQVRAAGGVIQVGASNGSGQTPITSDIPGAITVSESGWYTLRHVFRDVDGVLAVDMILVDADGTATLVRTLSAPQDTIGVDGQVGGNRYGWFTDISVPGGLRVDSLALGDFERGVVEAAETVSTGGVIPFSGVDLTDTHFVTVADGGTGYLGTFSTVLNDSTGDGQGSLGWTFTATAANLDRLAAGETVVQTYDLTLTDSAGATATQRVSVTITGTNDAPTVVADVAAVAEDALVTGSVATNDGDVDTGAVLTYALSAPVAGLTLADDGSYTFDAANAAYQDLAAGETRVVVASYTVTDEEGASAASTLTVTVTGTNDLPLLGFVQGFDVGTSGITTGGGYGAITVVPSGTDGIAAPDGDGFYAVVTEAGSGPFTRFGGSSAEFVDGAQAEVKVYLDAGWEANQSFQYTVAANGSDGAHQRDFAFQVRATGDGAIQIGASTGSGQAPITTDVPNATLVTESGWYTLRQVFNNVNGVLSVDMVLVDPDGNEIRIATLSAPADTIDQVGGTRYGWFTDISVDGGLAIDRLSLGNFEGAVTEDDVGVVSTGGVIPFGDVDLTDTHVVESAPVGAGTVGTFTATVVPTDGDGRGSVTWTYSATAAELDFLAADQSVDQSYTITLRDSHGGTSSQIVTVTLTGTNDTPVITLGEMTGIVAEAIAGETTVATSGSFSVADVDLAGTLTFAEGTTSVTWLTSDGTTPAGTVSQDLVDALNAPGAFTFTDSDDTTSAATIVWTWNATADLNFLAAGETLRIVTPVTIGDDGGSDPQTREVVVTITGTNDAPVVTPGVVTGVVNEAANQSNSVAETSPVVGTFAIADADANGSVTLSHALQGFTSTFNQRAGLTAEQQADLLAALTYDAPADNEGTVSWRFALEDSKLDFLRQGEQLTVTLRVSVDDGAGGTAFQDIVVTLNGTNDPLSTSVGSGDEVAGAITEVSGVPAAGAPALTDTGTFSYLDRDYSNPIVQVVGNTNLGRLTTVTEPAGALNETGGGKVRWTYSVDPSAVEYLAAGEELVETFTVRLTDTSGAAITQAIEVTVTGTNDAPTISTDATTATGAAREDTLDGATPDLTGLIAFTDVDVRDTHGVSFEVTANGNTNGLSDAALKALFSTSIASTAAAADGTVTWTFDAGTATFQHLREDEALTLTYAVTIDDGQGATVSQDVVITLTGDNDGVVAVDDTTAGDLVQALDNGVSADITGTGTVLANDTDLDSGDTKVVSAVSFGATGGTVGEAIVGVYGTLVLNADGTYTYTVDSTLAATRALAQGTTATEVFSYEVTDGAGATSIAMLTVTVTGGNDAPVAADDAIVGLVEAGHADDGSVVAGNDSVEMDLFANDGDVDGDARTVTGVAAGALSGAVGDAVQGAFGTLTVSADGSATYQLDNALAQGLSEGEVVTDTFTYAISDGHGGTDTATVTVTITGSNDRPVASDATASVNEDGVLTGATLTASDADGDAFTFALKGAAPAGLTLAQDGSYTFDARDAAYQHLADGATEQVVATFVVTDANGAVSEDRTLTITVTGRNDDPVAADDVLATTIIEAGAGGAGVPSASGKVLTNDTDVDDDALLTVTGIRAGTEGATVGSLLAANGTYGSIVINAMTGAYTYTLDNDAPAADALAADETVTETFTYEIRDEHGAADTATITVTVTGANDAPVANDDADTTLVEAGEAGTGILIATGSVLANDGDVDTGDLSELTVTVGTGARAGTYGTLTLAADGSWTYTLDPALSDAMVDGQTYVETFGYTVTDGDAATDTAVLTLTITGANDRPTIGASTDGGSLDLAGSEGGAEVASVTGALAADGNWSDVDAGEAALLTVARAAAAGGAQAALVFGSDGYATVAGLYGDLRIMADGSYVYALDRSRAATIALDADDTVIETFDYTIANGAGVANEAGSSVSFTITGGDDEATVVAANRAAVTETAASTVETFLIADQVTITDPDTADAAAGVRYLAKTASVSATGVPANFTDAELRALITLDAATGAISFDRAAFDALDGDEAATFTVSFDAQSGDDAPVTRSFTFAVQGVNDAPVAVADVGGSVAENASASFDVVGNDTDADRNDAAVLDTVVSASAVIGGTTYAITSLFSVVDGKVAFVPGGGLPGTRSVFDRLDPGESASVTVTYQVKDDYGATARSTLTFTVTGEVETFVGTDEDDTFAGSANDDVLIGGVGDDTLSGGSGSDRLEGGIGDDTLSGGAGDDHLYGGAGTDTLIGGADSDIAHFDGAWRDYDVTAAGSTYLLTRGDETTTLIGIEKVSFAGQAAVAIATIVNDAPVATGASATVAEDIADTAVIATVSATDMDAPLGDTMTFTLATNPDGLFEIDAATGAISLASGKALDREVATSHALTVTATDAKGASATAAVTITVTDVNDTAPVFTSGTTASVAENVAPGALVYTAAATDADSVGGPITYGLAGTDAAAFSIDATTGAVILLASPDHEAQASYSFSVVASQGSGPASTRDVILTVADVNEAPVATDVAVTVAEDAAGVLTTVAISDVDDGDTIGFEITAGNDDGLFVIDTATGAISLAAGRTLDHETDAVHALTVTVTDAGGLSDTAMVTIMVADVNEAPTTPSESATVAEDATIGGTLAVSDVDVGDTHTFVETTGVAGLTINPDGSWSFDAANAAYQSLAAGASLLVTAGYLVTDAGGLSATGTLSILVTGTNDAPTAVQISGASVAEYAIEGTVIGDLSTLDPDSGDSASYLLVDSAGGRFAIVDGKLVVAEGLLLDHEQAASHQITVRVTDAAGATHDQVLTIAVGDVSPESVVGSVGADTFVGGAGDDMFRGQRGNDVIDGGAGTDIADYRDKTVAVSVTLNGSTFATVFVGGVAEDMIRNIEQIYGGSGDDILIGDAGDNLFNGGGGDDVLRGGGGQDVLRGGEGNDTADYSDMTEAVVVTLKGANPASVTIGGVAGDTIQQIENVRGGAGDDRLIGDKLDNALWGGDGNDTLDGAAGADTMTGGAGNDLYVVRQTGDVVIEAADGGTDLVRAFIDHVLGENVENLTLAGTAKVGTGNALNNTINGGSRSDTLTGLAGDDQLNGSNGFDLLDGGEGADQLNGGVGLDRLIGGAGSDRFVFADGHTGATRNSADRIADFSHVEGDRVVLSAIDANTGANGNQAFSFVGTAAFSGVAGELRYAVIGGNTFVQGDTDGDKVADLMIQLDGVHALVASDFTL